MIEKCPDCGSGEWSVRKVDGVRICTFCGADYIDCGCQFKDGVMMYPCKKHKQ